MLAVTFQLPFLSLLICICLLFCEIPFFALVRESDLIFPCLLIAAVSCGVTDDGQVFLDPTKLEEQVCQHNSNISLWKLKTSFLEANGIYVFLVSKYLFWRLSVLTMAEKQGLSLPGLSKSHSFCCTWVASRCGWRTSRAWYFNMCHTWGNGRWVFEWPPLPGPEMIYWK